MEKIEKIYLKRQIGLLSAVAILVGNIIGSGIFISPKGVLSGTQSVGLCLTVWAGCGIISLFGGLCYAELGTMIGKSGSDYSYLLDIFGPYPAFLYCFAQQFFIAPSTNAVLSLTAAEYIAAPVFGSCASDDAFKKVTACWILLSCGMLNACSTKGAIVGSRIFTLLKLIAVAMIIITGFIALGKGKFDGISSGFSGTTNDAGDIVDACYSAFWAYSGWKGLNSVTEELKNYKKNLPRAITISMIVVILVYVAVNLAYFIVLGPGGILESDAVAVSFEEKSLETNFLLSTGVGVSTTGTLLAALLLGGRQMYASARETHIPEILSFVHIYSITPYTAIALKTLLSAILIFLGDVTTLIRFLSVLTWVFVGINMIGLVIMRFTRKDASRPYKVPFVFPVLMVFVALFLVLVPLIFKQRLEYLLAIGVIPVATLLYIPFIHYKKSIPGMDTLTMYAQLLLQVVPSGENVDG